MDKIIGKLNQRNQTLKGSLSVSSQRLEGTLNVYTMETGDGRELELAIVEGYICWRRVNDITWIQLVSLSSLHPVKGIDYWTEKDKEEILEYIDASIGNEIPHHNLSGRDEADQHPISAITGLGALLEQGDQKDLELDDTKLEAADFSEFSNSQVLELWNRFID